MAYEGEERRERTNVRTAIDRAKGNTQMALIRMARMLGPDRLGELDSELGAAYEEKRRQGMRAPSNPRATAWATSMRERPWNMVGDEILEKELSHYGVSGDVLKSLADAGISKVKQFTSRTTEQLKALGVTEDAISEMSTILLNWGIRTIENPPSWWKPDAMQGPQ